MGHTSTVPRLALDYFTRYVFPKDGWDHWDSILITSKFTPSNGWRVYPTRKRVSISELRRLRSTGVTHVGLSFGGREVDFSISELLSRRTTASR
jgi:hypothetical protein